MKSLEEHGGWDRRDENAVGGEKKEPGRVSRKCRGCNQCWTGLLNKENEFLSLWKPSERMMGVSVLWILSLLLNATMVTRLSCGTHTHTHTHTHTLNWHMILSNGTATHPHSVLIKRTRSSAAYACLTQLFISVCTFQLLNWMLMMAAAPATSTSTREPRGGKNTGTNN